MSSICQLCPSLTLGIILDSWMFSHRKLVPGLDLEVVSHSLRVTHSLFYFFLPRIWMQFSELVCNFRLALGLAWLSPEKMSGTDDVLTCQQRARTRSPPEPRSPTTSATTQICIQSDLPLPTRAILGLGNLSNLRVGACRGCVPRVQCGPVILPSMTTLNHP